MKIKLLLPFLIISAIANSQVIINGSFEKNIGGCNYGVTQSVFHSYLSDCYEFGGADQIDIMHDSCGYGTAQHGEYFIGLGVNGSSDAIAMQLDTALSAGTPYLLTFYKKVDPNYIGFDMVIGYSTDTLALGTAVDTVAAPVLNSWVQENVYFTPAYNANYITVQLYNGFFGWDLVDHFTLQTVTGVAFNDAANSIVLSPNPVTNKTYIHFNNINTKEVSFKIYNITGEEIKPLLIFNSNSIEISRQGLSSGMYLVKVLNHSTLVKEFKMIVM